MHPSRAEQTTDDWGRLARDYEAMFVPFSSAAATAALDRLDLRPGMRLLDVAARTGALTLQAAALGARVTAIDASEGMLQLLRAKADPDAAIETLVMDGEALDFPDETFDGAASNMGIVLFADPLAALREVRRVLRSGARAVVSSVASPADSSLMRTIFRALAEAGLEPAADNLPTLQPLADRDLLAAALHQAGFAAVTVETVTVPWEIEDAREFWRRWGTVAPPVAPLFRQLPADRLEVAGNAFARLVHEMKGPGTASFPSPVFLGTGYR